MTFGCSKRSSFDIIINVIRIPLRYMLITNRLSPAATEAGDLQLVKFFAYLAYTSKGKLLKGLFNVSLSKQPIAVRESAFLSLT